MFKFTKDWQYGGQHEPGKEGPCKELSAGAGDDEQRDGGDQEFGEQVPRLP